MAAFAMTKEKLVQDILYEGDKGKHLICLIKIMERKKITIFREIVCWLLQILEEHQPVKFTPEDLRYLHQEIIEGHEEGSKKPEENSNEDVMRNIEKQCHGGIQSRQPQGNDNIPPAVAHQAMLIRQNLLEPPQEILEQTESPLELTIGSELGEGSFGKVHQATAQVALKKPKGQRGQSDLINEIRILRWLKHENIVAFLGNKSGGLVLELTGENLHQHIELKGGSLRIDSIMGFGLDVAYGLEYLQQLGIVHLDLKSKNVLIKSGIAKLSDFGLSKVLTEHNVGHEVLHYDGQLYDSNSIFPESFKTDMWNFGWVLFEMTVGRSPDLKKLSLLALSKRRFPDLAELVAQCTLGVVPDGRLVVFQRFPNLEKLVTECIRIVPGGRPEILVARRILEKHFQMSP